MTFKILHFRFKILLKKMGKRKKEDYTFLRNKTEEKNSTTIIISVDGKRTVFPVKLKLQRDLFE